MKGVCMLAMFALCLVLANGKMSKDMKRIAGILGINYEENRHTILPDDENYAMKAQFDIDGVMEEKYLYTRMMNILTYDTAKFWVKTDSVQFVYYYLDGSSPVKVTILYANGTLGVKYVGSLMDKRCEILNCEYEIVQPVGCKLIQEVMDVEGWALLTYLVSPMRDRMTGFTVVSNSDLTCSL